MVFGAIRMPENPHEYWVFESLLAFFDSSLHRNNVRLPKKQVLDKMADKQKAVPEEAEVASFGTVFLCSKIHIGTQKCSKFVVKCEKIVVFRGFRGYFGANSGSAMTYIHSRYRF